MAEYLAPGVYVEERDSGLKPMEGVSTSTAGFIGMTQRGPLVGTPIFIGSYMDFRRNFGGYLDKATYGERRYLPMAVEQFFANGGSRCFVTRILASEDAAAATVTIGNITFTASSIGLGGNCIRILCKKNMLKPELFDLQIICTETPSSKATTCEESYADVTLDAAADNYLLRVLQKSLLVKAEAADGDVPDFYNSFPEQAAEKEQGKWVSVNLAGGLECKEGEKPCDKITADVLKGVDNGAGKRTGLNALKEIAEVSIVVAPGVTDPSEVQEIISHCENTQNRFAVLDMPEDMNQVTELQKYRSGFDTSYAAMYHPWIQVFDPLEKRPAYLPPSGSIAGVFARVDNTRGVHKAPANEVVRNCTGLEILFGKPEQDMLNPAGINLIRNIQGQGIRIWGARTCSSDSSWRYINVRRLFIFLEESIRRSTGWAVFEPNDDMLWTKVRNTITSFLGTQWRNGALVGAAEAEAFFVNVGLGSSMTQDDVLNGRMICEIGVAPSRPAEFVIFRISQIMETK